MRQEGLSLIFISTGILIMFLPIKVTVTASLVYNMYIDKSVGQTF
jgi:hypothetical protein